MRLPSTSSIARLHLGHVYLTTRAASSSIGLRYLLLTSALLRHHAPALGASRLSTVATTQGLQMFAYPALQSPPCRSIRVRAMIYPPPSPPARKRLGAHPLEIHCHRPLSPPAADMQTCGEHAARTAWLCRITHHIKNPQPAPSLENALSCGYDAQRRIRPFMLTILSPGKQPDSRHFCSVGGEVNVQEMNVQRLNVYPVTSCE